MAQNEGISAALQALSTIATTAAEIHKNTLIVEENVLDRRLKEREAEKNREQALLLQENSHLNKIDEDKIIWARSMLDQYPGLSTELDPVLGVQVPTSDAFSTYNWSDSKAVQEGVVTNTIESLTANSIPFDLDVDDDDILNQKLLAFQQGKNYSQRLFSSTLSPDVSFLLGGDVSLHQFTQEDVVDFEGFINLNTDISGNIGAGAVIELQKMGVLPATVDIKYDANNVPYIDSQDQGLVKTVIQGIKAGVTLNQNFMSSAKYHEWLQKNNAENIGFAATIAGSPHANKMATELGKVALSMQTKLGFTTDQDTGQIVMMTWAGQQKNFGEIIATIDESQLPPDQMVRLKNVVMNLKGVSQASGLEPLAIYLDTLTPAQFKTLQADLSGLGGGDVANELVIALDRYRKVNDVVNLTSKYITDPVSVDKAIGMRKDMEAQGIYSGLQEIRALEIQGLDSSDPMFKDKKDVVMQNILTVGGKYQGVISKIKTQLQSAKGADKIKLEGDLVKAERQYTEFREWIQLEQSVSNLSKATLGI